MVDEGTGGDLGAGDRRQEGGASEGRQHKTKTDRKQPPDVGEALPLGQAPSTLLLAARPRLQTICVRRHLRVGVERDPLQSEANGQAGGVFGHSGTCHLRERPRWGVVLPRAVKSHELFF